jgi:hypothetical protein
MDDVVKNVIALTTLKVEGDDVGLEMLAADLLRDGDPVELLVASVGVSYWFCFIGARLSALLAGRAPDDTARLTDDELRPTARQILRDAAAAWAGAFEDDEGT